METPKENTLAELANNEKTDKNTVHSYLEELYEKLMFPKKNTAKNVLEVGIYKGGSIRLWADYFRNATVYGLDVMSEDEVWEKIRGDERIILHTSCDAYNEETFKKNFLDKNIKCDILLDDGPHTLESMIQFIRLYSQIMADDGILIIEDVQNIEWIETLYYNTSLALRPYIKYYDLRTNKNRYDDIVFTIDKSKVPVSP